MDRVWRRSSYSSQQYVCVEVARNSDTTAVRDSKDPDGPHLTFSSRTFAKFLRALNEQ